MELYDEKTTINKIIDSFAQSPSFNADLYVRIAKNQSWGGTTEFTNWHYRWTSTGLEISHIVNGECEYHRFTLQEIKERTAPKKQVSFFDL